MREMDGKRLNWSRSISRMHVLFMTQLAASVAMSLNAACMERFDSLIPPPDSLSLVPGEPKTATEPGGSALRAGAAKVEITPPIGVPLAGWGQIQRRNLFPDLNSHNAFALFKPSTGIKDPLFARALVLADGQKTVALLTMDVIATDRELVDLLVARLIEQNIPISIENLMVCASHTHSGPGTLTGRQLWEVAATDLLVPHIREEIVNKAADAIAQAYADLQPARFGSTLGQINGATRNRRAGVSPDVQSDSIDPELAVMRFDREDARPIAVLWNFAIHGTAWGAENLEYSADVMGEASQTVEASLGCPALFINAAEGDIAPLHNGTEALDDARSIMAPAILGLAQSAQMTSVVHLESHSQTIYFGAGELHLKGTPQLLEETLPSPDCTSSCAAAVHYELFLPLTLGADAVENEFRFQSIRLNDTIIASVPGEPIMELGRQIKSDGRALGYRNVLIAALANGHMGYITTQSEYFYGGYESALTLWGPGSAAQVRNACFASMSALR